MLCPADIGNLQLRSVEDDMEICMHMGDAAHVHSLKWSNMNTDGHVQSRHREQQTQKGD